MDFSNVTAAFGIGLGLLVGLAAVLAYLRGTAIKEDMRRLRQSNNDLRNEVVDKERRLEQVEEDNASLKVEQARLQADSIRKDAALARIGEQAASGAELSELARALREASGLARDHDREAAARHAATIKALRDVHRNLDEMKSAISAREKDT